MRMVAFIRSLGKGYSALQKFSLYLNSPPPMAHASYRSAFSKLHKATKQVASDSMMAAAEEVRSMSNAKLDVPGPIDCQSSFDGTWQIRGHASHNGVVTAISVDTGKCLDIEVLCNICKSCQCWESKKGTVEYDLWKVKHVCKMNHGESAGAMEAVGSVRIFSRSEQTRNLRYTHFLGDGDSSSFKKVVESKPYGNTLVEKLECVGHVQKRCGTRLWRLKTA